MSTPTTRGLSGVLRDKGGEIISAMHADFLAVGNGVANDTTPLTNAELAAAAPPVPMDVFLPGGNDFLVTALPANNPGVRYVGPGRILKAITGGNQQLNSYGDLHQYAFGREYLYAFHARNVAGSGANVVLTGDSTTAGTNASGDFIPSALLLKIARARGVFFNVFYNRGQSGKNSADWLATYVAGDITNGGNPPHLIIVRWGINDPYTGTGTRTTTQYFTSMRAALAQIRATYTVAQCSILLMAPNSVSDTPGNRDERWNEAISLGLRQMARDYQCCFYDTYARFRDARSLAGTGFDDIGTGQAVHPGNAMNGAIYSDIAELIYPPGMAPVASNRFQNLGASDTTINTATLPSAFDKGITMSRADQSVDTAWPLNGAAMTVRQIDGTFVLQWNWSYNNGLTALAFRVGQTATWYPWVRLFSAPSGITYSASMTPDCSIGKRAVINANNNTAFAINVPTGNPQSGQELAITIRNTSAGALGAATWNAIYKLATWTQPATLTSRTITFEYDGTNWIETGRTPADVPN